ncbi:hypothetical protein IG631_02977 [Alternaria alternata]|nr:hypothetical protein IG631_02977 [Alternaria alternata]
MTDCFSQMLRQPPSCSPRSTTTSFLTPSVLAAKAARRSPGAAPRTSSRYPTTPTRKKRLPSH